MANAPALARFLVLPWLLASAMAVADCPPAGWDAARLQALKADGFEIADAAERQALALALLDCLADPDPALRDGVAFEAQFTWMRAGALDEATRVAVLDRLLAQLTPEGADAAGFRQPFAALVLAEVARADRKAPFLSAQQRVALADAAAAYLRGMTDLRGFDPVQGWRHGVAHTADLMMQLSLNGKVEKPQLDAMLGALAAKVAPAGEHAYVHGETERLARPVLFTAMRGLHSPEEWQAWFQTVVAPAPMSSWKQAQASLAGLAKRHNTRAFMLVVYTEIRDSKEEKLVALLPAVTAAMSVLQ